MEHRGKSGKESPTRGLGEKPCKEGRMDQEEMRAYIIEKLKEADYLETEMVYGLILGLFGKK